MVNECKTSNEEEIGQCMLRGMDGLITADDDDNNDDNEGDDEGNEEEDDEEDDDNDESDTDEEEEEEQQRGECAAWCGPPPEPWEEKCKWQGCDGCDVCVDVNGLEDSE